MRYLRPAAADASVPLLFPGLPATRGGANGDTLGCSHCGAAFELPRYEDAKKTRKGQTARSRSAGMRHGMADIAAASEAAT